MLLCTLTVKLLNLSSWCGSSPLVLDNKVHYKYQNVLIYNQELQFHKTSQIEYLTDLGYPEKTLPSCNFNQPPLKSPLNLVHVTWYRTAYLSKKDFYLNLKTVEDTCTVHVP